MSDFLTKADLLRPRYRPGTYPEIDDVFDAISDLRGVFEKANIDLNNIEELFSSIEMAGLLHKLADRSQESISKLRSSLVTLIFQTIEDSMHFNGDRAFDFGYDRLVKAIKAQQKGDYSWCSFITFNYDVALDYVLRFNGLKYSYTFQRERLLLTVSRC